METFCSQAVGAGNYRAVGITYQRAVLLSSLCCIAVGLAWSRSELLFRALGCDATAGAVSRGGGGGGQRVCWRVDELIGVSACVRSDIFCC